MSAETDAELAALRYQDNSRVLNDSANRANTESITANNHALIKLIDAKVRLRTTVRRCAVALMVLLVCWSVWFWCTR